MLWQGLCSLPSVFQSNSVPAGGRASQPCTQVCPVPGYLARVPSARPKVIYCDTTVMERPEGSREGIQQLCARAGGFRCDCAKGLNPRRSTTVVVRPSQTTILDRRPVGAPPPHPGCSTFRSDACRTILRGTARHSQHYIGSVLESRSNTPPRPRKS